MEIQELQFGHRRVCLYHLVEGPAPLVYSIDYHENGQLLLEASKQVGCSGFNLVTISGLHWNQELSPWLVETVVSKDDRFTGGAPELLPIFTDEIVPQVENLLDAPPVWRCLAGYSLGGLFAVWTAFQTDLFTRILYGGRISLSFCLVSIFFTFLIGLTLGGLSGYLGGIFDTIVQRAIDLIMSMPSIPLWMALAAAMPKEISQLRQYLLMSIIMSLIGWTGLARVVRGKILSLREEDFVTAARLSGAGHGRIIAKHMLPSFLSYIIVSITGSIPATILGETSLSFLGLGLQAPTISWGTLLQDCQTVETVAAKPWLMFPALFIVISVLMFNFAGDGLRDAADPYK